VLYSRLGFSFAHGAPLRMTRSAFLALLVTAALGTAALAQVGHPAKGSWSGYWGTSDTAKRRMLLVLDWRDRQITGVINPGPNQVPIDKADLNVDTWTLRLEAAMPTSGGGKAPFVATGQLTNLGSWTTRTYSGTYVFGTETGRFTVTLN
jgi:hypothetical protein